MKTKNDILHILVIDDDEFLLSAIKKKLEHGSYKVTTSSNIHDAYFKLGFIKPDLIMLDVIMPDINGIEFMSMINSQHSTSSIPIMLMSYLPKKELSKMGYSIGKAHYLTKPFNVNNLSVLLKRFFNQPNKTQTSNALYRK